MKKYIQILAITLLPFLSNAQGMDDALRYSFFNIEGTARAGAMGNAFGALGGDFTSVGINPAGLAVYRSNQFTITPSFEQSYINSDYINNSTKENSFNFSMTNLSYVTPITFNPSQELLINFGIGYNRLKDFNEDYGYSAKNSNGSFLDYYVEDANYFNNVNDDFYSGLLWDTNLLYKDDNDNIYRHDLEDVYGQLQTIAVETSGSINEYTMALGFNFSHKFYVGASLGIVDVFYEESKSIMEDDVDNRSDIFDGFTFDQHLKTTGTGYNGKIGIIYKPIQSVRLGAAFHTPTFYNLNDLFETSSSSQVNLSDGSNWHKLSPLQEYDYDLETPIRATFSGAFVSDRGLISVDYEIVDYSSAKLKKNGKGNAFSQDNNDISNAYKLANNMRVGGEYRLNKEFSLRAGYEYYDSPFESSEINEDASLNIATAGFGYRKGNISFDVAYRYKNNEFKQVPYAEASQPFAPVNFANIDNQKHKVLMTLSYVF